MTFLVFDIGHSTIKLGKFKGDKLIAFEVYNDLEECSEIIDDEGIIGAAISSVEQSESEKLARFLRDTYNISPFLVTPENKYNLQIVYQTPLLLGIDRICAAEGAFYLFRKKYEKEFLDRKNYIIVVDFGTTTTLSLIKYPNIFKGCTITPGIGLMFKTIKSFQPSKVVITAENYVGYIGKNLKESVAAGIMNTQLGMIEKVVNILKKKKGAEKIFIYITGGNSEKILKYLNFDYKFERGLAHYGIKSIFDLNMAKE
jgi:type III pantothenate kinase